MDNKVKYYNNYFFFSLLLSGAISISFVLPAIIFQEGKYALLSIACIWGIPALYEQIKKNKKDRLIFLVIIIINFLVCLYYEKSGSALILLTILIPIGWVGNIYWKFTRKEE